MFLGGAAAKEQAGYAVASMWRAWYAWSASIMARR
jgi:hypothetical protein